MAVSFNLPDPYEAQKAEIARRQKYAETLQQQAFQPVEQFSYQGIPAPVPIAATLAKILQGAGGAYLSKKAEDEARELREGDIKKGQEFAAALQGAKTPEEREKLTLEALGGTMGQRAQAIAGPMLQMTETRAEKERARVARAQEQADRRESQERMQAMMLELRAQGMSETAAHRAAMLELQRELGRGRLEGQAEERERRAQADRDRAAQLTMPEQHQLFQVMNQAEAGQSSVSALREARAYSDKFQGGSAGVGASWLERQAAAIAGVTPSESAQATAMYNNIMGTEMLGKLRATFGSNPTNAEREVLTKLQASASEPQSVRNALLDRAIRLAEERQKRAEAEAEAIRTRSYRQPGGQPAAPTPPAAPQRPGAPQAPGAAPGQQPGGGGLTPEEQRELEALRARFPRAQR
jgi:hypothetical protein